IFNLTTKALIIVYKTNKKLNNKITSITSTYKYIINIIYTTVIKRGFNSRIKLLKLENKYSKDILR
ncbi:hypothetical protein BDU57DRAFT_461950, partial [Ampelomyces quisqualis]